MADQKYEGTERRQGNNRRQGSDRREVGVRNEPLGREKDRRVGGRRRDDPKDS